MLRWKRRLLLISYVLLDLLAVVLGTYISVYILRDTGLIHLVMRSTLEVYGFITLSAASFFITFWLMDMYGSIIKSQERLALRIFGKSAAGFFLGFWILNAVFTLSNVPVTALQLLVFTLICFALSNILRAVFKSAWSYQKKDSEHVKNILILGYSNHGAKYISTIKKYYYLNLNIIGFLHINPKYDEVIKRAREEYQQRNEEKRSEDDMKTVYMNRIILGEIKFPEGTRDRNAYPSIHHFGNIERLEEVLASNVVDEIVVAKSLSYDKRLKGILSECQDRGITITMLLKRQNYDTAMAQVSMIGDIPALKFHTVSLNEGQIYAKRILDIIGSSIGMILFGIAYIIFAPLIKLESKGPVLFKQDRVGKNGRVFKIWKFRSMGVDAEERKKELAQLNEMQGNMFKLTNDPRVTRLGAFLRKTSIDELPQFYNVFVGDMSLVGTRPPTVQEVAEYKTHHYKRISVIPGITGLWQISGRSDIKDFEEVVRLDREYISNWTVWLDIKILFKTVLVVLKRRGSK